MAFKRISGVSNLIPAPKTASTAYAAGSTVAISTTGFFVAAAATSPSILGVLQQSVAATDGDYAKNTLELVDIGDANTVWEVDVANGGVATPFAATDVFQFFKLGATASVIDANTRATAQGNGFTAQGLVFFCVGFIAPTTTVSDTTTGSGKGLFKIMSSTVTRPASA